MMGNENEEEHWNRVVVPRVCLLVSPRLSQTDICSLLCVSTLCRQLLSSNADLWKVLNLQGRNKAGQRLAAALSLPRFQHVHEINLEFAQDLEDHHLLCMNCKELQVLNLNACQKITDNGVQTVATLCLKLHSFSIYWNLRIADAAVEALLTNCKELTFLNFSGCKGVTDTSLKIIAKHRTNIKHLNLTRCLKLTDDGLIQLLENCQSIEELYLYAVSSFSEHAYTKLSNLQDLKLLDLCGAQNLTDHAIALGLALCGKLESLNLTWCVHITDHGVKAIAQNCRSLVLLSLHGLAGVTDEGLESLSKSCSRTLQTIDVNGCINIKRRSREELIQLFPLLKCFSVHS